MKKVDAKMNEYDDMRAEWEQGYLYSLLEPMGPAFAFAICNCFDPYSELVRKIAYDAKVAQGIEW